MKAQVINQFGSPSNFESTQLQQPALQPGHVLIRVKATSVNPIDYKLRRGDIPGLIAGFPAVLHGDVAGIVEAVSSDVTRFKAGDEVFGCAGGLKGCGGALAEYMVADARLLAKKPVSLSMQQAAALPLVSLTAWEALFEKVKMLPGQKILIHAGTGGVGHIGIQLAKWAGATVYATVSSPEKAAIAKQLGATDTVDYKNESVTDYVQRLTDGNGFDIVFDTVGAENINQSIAALALYGNVVTIQANSTNDLSGLHAKSGSLHAVLMLIPLIYNTQRERHGKILEKIAELADQGVIKPLLDDHRFAMNEAGAAHALLESGKALGKVVISIE